jgi:hypothetical protein
LDLGDDVHERELEWYPCKAQIWSSCHKGQHQRRLI